MANPFAALRLDDSSFLLQAASREACPGCGKSRMFLCYTCNVATHYPSKIPRLKLPFRFDIIKHNREYMGKSTSPQAVILAPEDCKIYTYPAIPSYDPKKTLLLYPGSDAKPLAFYCRHPTQLSVRSDPETTPSEIDRIVAIDSTWRQASSIAKHEALTNLPMVKLNHYQTQYWRFHKDNPHTCLSTIEAIYYCCVEHFNATRDPSGREDYDGRYDNLLFYFAFFHRQMCELARTQGKTFEAFRARHTNSALPDAEQL